MQNSIMPTVPMTTMHNDGFGGGNSLAWVVLLLLFGDRGRWGAAGTDGTGVVTPTLFLQGLSGISNSLNEMALSNQANFADNTIAIRNASDYLSAGMTTGFTSVADKIGVVGDKVTTGNFAIAQELCRGFCGSEKTTLGVGTAMSKELNCVDRNLSNMITNNSFANQSGFNTINYNLQSGIDRLASQAAAYNCEQLQATKDGTAAIINKLDAMKAAEDAATIAALQAELRDRANRDSFIEISNRQIGSNTVSVNSNNNIASILSDFATQMRELTYAIKKSA